MTAGTFHLGGRPTTVAVGARSLLRALRLELVWFTVLLTIVGLAHGVNMFDYPYYENDEGTYISQAWALLNLGELAPYTYWYDHAPFGWIQIAAWTLVTGGFYTFGDTVESGRVLMLVYQIGSAALVYFITRRITNSVATASLAMLVFGLSVFGIFFHRRVLLDNIAAFWALLSIYCLIHGRLTLWRTWLSALCLALGILSKESVVFLLPVLAYLTWHRSHSSQQLLAVVGWFAVAGCVVSLYVLMAALKGELFPSGSLLSGTTEHVSLLGSVSYQASRGSGSGELLDPNSDFWRWATGWQYWVSQWGVIDGVLLVGGTAAAVINVLLIRWRRVGGVIGLLTISLWAFIGRGGIVIEFYLVPLLPLLAISLGIAAHQSLTWAAARVLPPRFAWQRFAASHISLFALASAVAIGQLLIPNATSRFGDLWTSPVAAAQREAIAWIREHLSTSDGMLIDAYGWTDLQGPPAHTRSFPLAHWYWKADLDPDIREGVLAGDWRNLDYVITTPQMRRFVAEKAPLPLTSAAIEHSTPIAHWDTDGWEVAVQRVDKVRSIPASSNSILTSLWANYTADFLEGGRVIDAATGGRTTSEGQGYAMLQAVYQDDRHTFDEVWTWTKQKLQQSSGLFAWLYGARADGPLGVIDRGAASDADQDIALALLFASKRWEDVRYASEASIVLDGIWNDLTTVVRNERYLVAGQWAGMGALVINPSYLAPYAYRIFADADRSHAWGDLVDSSYHVMDAIANSSELGGQTGAVPNWVGIDRATGVIGLAPEMGRYGEQFSFDASRVPWHLAVDYLWFGDERALRLLGDFDLAKREIERTGRLASEYGLDGSVVGDYESISMYAGTLPSLLLGGAEKQAYEILARKVIAPMVSGDQQVGYYDRNWAWFTIALFDGGFSNLWIGADRYVWRDELRAAPGNRASDQRP